MGVLDIFFVGGEPDRLEEAAESWRWLADDMTIQSGILDRVAAGTLDSWSMGDARDAYADTTAKLKKGYAEFAPDLKEIADALDDIAREIRDAKREAAALRAMVAAAIAGGVALFVFTAGGSAAASAATVSTATVTMGTLLRTLALRIAAAAARMWTITQVPRWGMGLSALATVTVKGWKGELDQWSRNDISNIILGGFLATGMGATAVKLSGMKAVQAAVGTGVTRRVVVNAAAGLGGGFTGTAINQFGFNGQPLNSAQAWKTSATVGGIAAFFGGAFRTPFKRPPLSAAQKSPGMAFPPMRPGDKLRQITGLPTGWTVVIFKDKGTGETVRKIVPPSSLPALPQPAP